MMYGPTTRVGPDASRKGRFAHCSGTVQNARDRTGNNEIGVMSITGAGATSLTDQAGNEGGIDQGADPSCRREEPVGQPTLKRTGRDTADGAESAAIPSTARESVRSGSARCAPEGRSPGVQSVRPQPVSRRRTPERTDLCRLTDYGEPISLLQHGGTTRNEALAPAPNHDDQRTRPQM